MDSLTYQDTLADTQLQTSIPIAASGKVQVTLNNFLSSKSQQPETTAASGKQSASVHETAKKLTTMAVSSTRTDTCKEAYNQLREKWLKWDDPAPPVPEALHIAFLQEVISMHKAVRSPHPHQKAVQSGTCVRSAGLFTYESLFL